MYDPHAKDLKEREKLRRIWEPLPYHPCSWRPENSLDNFHISGSDEVSLLQSTSDNVVDYWELSNGLSTPNTILRDTLTSFAWSQDLWSLGDTANAGCQDQEDLPFTQAMMKQEVPSSQNIVTDSLDTLVGSLHVSNNGSMATHGSSSKNESLWFSSSSLSDNNGAIASEHRWLTDSIGFIRCNPFYSLECALKQKYMLIKIENIPWVVSADEIKKALGRFIQPSPDKLEHTIHVMMDTSTGKTDNKAFLQVVDCDYNRKLMNEDQTSYVIHCRRIHCSLCPQDEFLRALYPSWPGTFQDGKALLSENNDKHPIFITQRELQSLGNVCRNYKLHFNRKSGERPFLYMKSLVLNLPWHQERIVTTAQRDILYESYKIMARYIAGYSKKEHTPFDVDTVSSFVRPVLECCGFTPKQRRAILNEANLTCPAELTYSIKDPEMPLIVAE
ncbi:hypothetical protein K501DRAFT_304357 [Backusella circina FSU 941]|nr:hypothetical protein K501DRAFT_304357 [Backusella circina FSU 941]